MDRADLMDLVYADGQPFVPETLSGKPRCRGRAKSRGGAQCAEATVPGATVCRIHGGAAPQVQRAATLRLMGLVNPAIATLARVMTTAPNPADQTRAANSILDRAGVTRQHEMTYDDALAFMNAEAERYRARVLAENTITGETV